MSERETQTVVGTDGLVAFGEYLEELYQKDYTFEMEDKDGQLALWGPRGRVDFPQLNPPK